MPGPPRMSCSTAVSLPNLLCTCCRTRNAFGSTNQARCCIFCTNGPCALASTPRKKSIRPRWRRWRRCAPFSHCWAATSALRAMFAPESAPPSAPKAHTSAASKCGLISLISPGGYDPQRRARLLPGGVDHWRDLHESGSLDARPSGRQHHPVFPAHWFWRPAVLFLRFDLWHRASAGGSLSAANNCICGALGNTGAVGRGGYAASGLGNVGFGSLGAPGSRVAAEPFAHPVADYFRSKNSLGRRLVAGHSGGRRHVV